MRPWIVYVIVAAFFVGGYAISTIDWSATRSRPIPCGGGGKTVWHETVPDQTQRTPPGPPILLPRPATEQSEGSQREAPAGAAPAAAEPQPHFC